MCSLRVWQHFAAAMADDDQKERKQRIAEALRKANERKMRLSKEPEKEKGEGGPTQQIIKINHCMICC